MTNNIRGLINGITGFITLLYPVAVYIGIQYFQPSTFAVLLLFFLLLRLVTESGKKTPSYFLFLVSLVFCCLLVWNNDLLTLRFYPALVNFALLLIFVASLYYPPPVIERLARIQHPDLPEQGVIYTRKVTQVWCIFFFINGSIAIITALYSSFAWWSLYNGFITYLLMGLLMGIEYLVRIRTQAHVR